MKSWTICALLLLLVIPTRLLASPSSSPSLACPQTGSTVAIVSDLPFSLAFGTQQAPPEPNSSRMSFVRGETGLKSLFIHLDKTSLRVPAPSDDGDLLCLLSKHESLSCIGIRLFLPEELHWKPAQAGVCLAPMSAEMVLEHLPLLQVESVEADVAILRSRDTEALLPGTLLIAIERDVGFAGLYRIQVPRLVVNRALGERVVTYLPLGGTLSVGGSVLALGVLTRPPPPKRIRRGEGTIAVGSPRFSLSVNKASFGIEGQRLLWGEASLDILHPAGLAFRVRFGPILSSRFPESTGAPCVGCAIRAPFYAGIGWESPAFSVLSLIGVLYAQHVSTPHLQYQSVSAVSVTNGLDLRLGYTRGPCLSLRYQYSPLLYSVSARVRLPVAPYIGVDLGTGAFQTPLHSFAGKQYGLFLSTKTPKRLTGFEMRVGLSFRIHTAIADVQVAPSLAYIQNKASLEDLTQGTFSTNQLDFSDDQAWFERTRRGIDIGVALSVQRQRSSPAPPSGKDQ